MKIMPPIKETALRMAQLAQYWLDLREDSLTLINLPDGPAGIQKRGRESRPSMEILLHGR